MLIVVALGGNALLRRGERPDLETQRRNLAAAVDAIAALAREHAIVVTHGNGPQIGLLALRDAAPLDALGAESEGMLGYLIEQELANALGGRDVAALLTRVTVDPRDPAFARPEKPIGPAVGEAEAQRLMRERGWTMRRDGERYRRVVPSPEPLRVIERRTIRLLVEAGVTVVCAGGGGIPVAVDDAGAAHGVEAVIDKDLASALLARELEADALLLLTDVPCVYADWPLRHRPIGPTTPAELRRHRFAAGSMAPKAEAACRFVERTRGRAGIGALADAAGILAGTHGTLVLP